MNTKLDQFTDNARKVLERAQREALQVRHDFVGTEHLLLALVSDDSDAATDALRLLGAGADKIRAGIEALIPRGTEDVRHAVLPLTPRAERALACAREEGAWCKYLKVDTGHILLGLLREPDGVAGKVLRNLGVDLESVREQVMKLRLLQYRIVERAVRPLRAPVATRRKMREELLAHLEAIYEEEREKSDDPFAAVKAAAERFGDPAALSRELDASLSRKERFAHWLERFYSWRAPESAARFVFRQSLLLFVLMAAVGTAAAYLQGISGSEFWLVLRELIYFVVLMPLNLFVLGILFFKMRDAQLGMFGSRKSAVATAKYTCVFAMVVSAAFIAFFSVLDWSWHLSGAELARDFGAGIFFAILYFLAARNDGPKRMADTMWESLKLAD